MPLPQPLSERSRPTASRPPESRRASTGSCAQATLSPSVSSARASCRCHSARWSASIWREPRGYPLPMSILEQVQAHTRDAMKAGERDRVGALRLIANALQQDAKEGKDDEVAVLRGERNRRLEAASAYREGGSEDRAASEESEAELIQAYLPAELAEDELAKRVDAAVEEA